uniref:outer membrane lipoprotein chaperone LolA n=1 Tax=Ningiella ruwaisensis TaxID=2364274 RepID=UPI00109FE20E|nr:outer membrane lipoprotein chaperone LolA [Ningiella ruwaisensis]
MYLSKIMYYSDLRSSFFKRLSRDFLFFAVCICSLAFASFSDTAIAQTSNSQEASNADAQRAKIELKEKLAELKNLQASFTQVIKDEQGETLQQSEGTITLSKPNKLRWEVKSPDESLFIADGEVVYNIDPFVEQVSIISQSAIESNNPLMLLISDNENAWENVNISELQIPMTLEARLPGSQDSNPDRQFIRGSSRYLITTLEQDATIVALELTFDKENLLSLRSTDRQGQVNFISLSKQRTNKALPADLFRPEFPETYIIDDQR